MPAMTPLRQKEWLLEYLKQKNAPARGLTRGLSDILRQAVPIPATVLTQSAEEITRESIKQQQTITLS
jgi:hypothetical protein